MSVYGKANCFSKQERCVGGTSPERQIKSKSLLCQYFLPSSALILESAAGEADRALCSDMLEIRDVSLMF